MKERVRKIRDDKAQTILEYVMVIGIVVLALVAMTPGIKRSVQAVVKVTADQLGTQEESEQSADPQEGYLINQFTTARISSTKEERANPSGPYSVAYHFHDRTQTNTDTHIFMGFTNKDMSY